MRYTELILSILLRLNNIVYNWLLAKYFQWDYNCILSKSSIYLYLPLGRIWRKVILMWGPTHELRLIHNMCKNAWSFRHQTINLARKVSIALGQALGPKYLPEQKTWCQRNLCLLSIHQAKRPGTMWIFASTKHERQVACLEESKVSSS